MNRNVKVKQPTNEPYFSFENFMFSNLTRVTTENRSCRICKRATTVAYLYKDVTYYAHYDCLSIYFLYQFFNQTKSIPLLSGSTQSSSQQTGEGVTAGPDGSSTDPNQSENVGTAEEQAGDGGQSGESDKEAEGEPKKQFSLYSLFDLNFEDRLDNVNPLSTTQSTKGGGDSRNGEREALLDRLTKVDARRRCHSCGIGEGDFKCIVDGCENFLHVTCSGNGNTIVYTTPLVNLNVYTSLRSKPLNVITPFFVNSTQYLRSLQGNAQTNTTTLNLASAQNLGRGNLVLDAAANQLAMSTSTTNTLNSTASSVVNAESNVATTSNFSTSSNVTTSSPSVASNAPNSPSTNPLNPYTTANPYTTPFNGVKDPLSSVDGDNALIIEGIGEMERVVDSYLRMNVLNVKEKLVSYRFLICYKHINATIINNIKLLFLCKLIAVRECQQVNSLITVISNYTSYNNKLKEDKKAASRGLFRPAATPSVPNQVLVNHAVPTNPVAGVPVNYTINRKEPEKDRVGDMGKREVKREILIGKDQMRNEQLRKEQELKKDEGKRNIMMINNLMCEYNMYKKSNLQKNNKPFNPSSFNILFQPTSIYNSPLFNSNVNNLAQDVNSNLILREDEVLEKDIRMLLNSNNNVYNIYELKKITSVNEFNIQNLVVTMRQMLYSQGREGGPDGLSGEEGTVMRERDVYRLLERRPRFILLKLYNKYIWLAMAQMGPASATSGSGGANLDVNSGDSGDQDRSGVKRVILEYIVLSTLEYIYLKNVVNSIYRVDNSLLLLLHNRPDNTTNSGSNDGNSNSGKATSTTSSGTGRTTTSTSNASPGPSNPSLKKEDVINLCGYSWDVNPPLYSLHRNQQSSPTASVNSGRDKLPDDDSFVHKQSIALLTALKTTNNNIEACKRNIENNIIKDSYKYNNLCFNSSLVNFYQNVSTALHRYNHFRQAIQKSILYYNPAQPSSLRFGSLDGVTDEGNQTIATQSSLESIPSHHNYATDLGDAHSMSSMGGPNYTGVNNLPNGTGNSTLAGSKTMSTTTTNSINDPSLNTYANSEEEADPGEERVDDEKAKINREYCSVCLMSELSHKHILMQCQKCYLRIHYRCYYDYNLAATLNKEGKNPFYCDPCSIEYNQRYEANYNSAICVACLSSGGAMKSIYSPSAYAAKAKRKDDEKWIHLICLVFIMPRVVCYDFSSLNQWCLLDTGNAMSTCSICGVVGGIQVGCCFSKVVRDHPHGRGDLPHSREDISNGRGDLPNGREERMDLCEEECEMRFHPMCCLLSGCYIRYSGRNGINLNQYQLQTYMSSFFNTLFSARDAKNVASCEGLLTNLFQAIILEPLCLKHTTVLYTSKFVNEQRVKRCFAYTHYLHHPDGFKDKKKYNSLPIEPIYSPVTITKDGPIKSQPRVVPQDFTKKFSIDEMNKRVKYNEPYLISVIYGLPKNLCGDVPKYGITAITNYLSHNPGRAGHGHAREFRDFKGIHDDKLWYSKYQQQYLINK